MKIKKVGMVYWVYFTAADGSQRSKSLDVTTFEEAETLCKEMGIEQLEQLAKHKLLSADIIKTMLGRNISTQDAFDQYHEYMKTIYPPNTLKNYVSPLQELIALNKNKKIWEITIQDIDAIINPKGRMLKRDSMKVRLAAIRGFFKFCVSKAFIMEDPSKLVRIKHRELTHEQKQKLVKFPISHLEYRRIMEHCVKEKKDFWIVSTAIAYWCGLRMSDICNLEWSSFTPEGIQVWTLKRDKLVVLPIDHPLINPNNELMNALTYLEYNNNRFCFPVQRELNQDPKTQSHLPMEFARILKKLGIKQNGKSFHSLRHSFVTRLKKAGLSFEEIGKLVAHGSEEMTKGYCHQDLPVDFPEEEEDDFSELLDDEDDAELPELSNS